MHSEDVEANMEDPLLFPFTLPVEDMKKLPQTILSTSEFDWMRRDVHMIIPKMKEAGIYVDHTDYSGVQHGFQYSVDEPKHALWFDDMKEIYEKHLL